MTEEPHDEGKPQNEPQETPPPRPEDAPAPPHVPQIVIPRSLYIATALILIGSFAITLFVRNPYTQSVTEGGGFYEHGTDNSALMWVAIFVGIPLSFWAYKRWILPLFERK
jgi:uracil-DNA glycosylase